jgi:hypothetical protein
VRQVQMRVGGRHSPSGLCEGECGKSEALTADRAGANGVIRTDAGSKDCGLLQLKPALQAEQESFFVGGWPFPMLHEALGFSSDGQQSPSIIWDCAIPESPSAICI